MRQDSSASLGAVFAADATALESDVSDTTLVNGYKLSAIWMRAQPGRIQQFVQPTQMAPPGYDVILPANALSLPYSLAVGMTVTWLADGTLPWSGEVRDIDPMRANNVIIGYRALVLMVPV